MCSGTNELCNADRDKDFPEHDNENQTLFLCDSSVQVISHPPIMQRAPMSFQEDSMPQPQLLKKNFRGDVHYSSAEERESMQPLKNF